jgi:hypothetical protein
MQTEESFQAKLGLEQISTCRADFQQSYPIAYIYIYIYELALLCFFTLAIVAIKHNILDNSILYLHLESWLQLRILTVFHFKFPSAMSTMSIFIYVFIIKKIIMGCVCMENILLPYINTVRYFK